MKKYTHGTMARRSYGRHCLLPNDFDLNQDYEHPKSYKALVVPYTSAGVPDSKIRDYRSMRVRVDHDATKTATYGKKSEPQVKAI